MDTTPQTALIENQPQPGTALSIRRFFTSPGVHPFDSVEWETRDARIGHGDRIAFEQEDVEFPKSWSQNATNIVAQKYFRGQIDSPARERIDWRSTPVQPRHIAGSVLFGTGWALADACPGPIATQLGQGIAWSLFTLAGVVVGIWVFLRRRPSAIDA